MTFKGDIDKVMVEINSRSRKLLNEVAMETTQRLKEKTPVRTGRMQRSWGIERKQDSIELYNVAPYSRYVNDGTPTQAPQRIVERTLMEMDNIIEVSKGKAGIK
jgi:HK97 gp10 family phage protein